MNPEDRLDKILRSKGLRVTKPRRIVFEFLVNADEPVKLRQVISLAGAWADRASLYRTIKLFQELEIIQEVHRSGGYWLELGESFSGHHHHMSCANCGVNVPITNTSVENKIKELARQANFDILDHQLEITGLCNDCKKLASSNQQVVK